MKSLIKFFQTIPGVALATLLILLVPLIAMQFSNEVEWSVGDFVIMGILIFSVGVLFLLVTRYTTNLVYKAAMCGAIGSTFLLIWSNMAVGLIGAGPHMGNMMYIGVVAIVIIGTFFSKFTAHGMELAMFAAAGSLVLLAGIALLANMDEYPGSSVTEIIAVNAFFAFLFSVTGLLFRYVALEQTNKSDH